MELFRQAFIIMTLGMSLVFVFLAFVILAINLAAMIIHRIEGEPQEDADVPDRDPAGLRRRVAAMVASLQHLGKTN